MSKTITLFKRPGFLREYILRHIKKLSAGIHFQKITQKKWRFINTETSLNPPKGVKIPKKQPYFPDWFITGRSKKGLNELKSMFVLPGETLQMKTNAERLIDANQIIVKSGISFRKKLEKSRAKLAKAFFKKETLVNTAIKREVRQNITRKLIASRNMLNYSKINKMITKINLSRITGARAKGITFIRKNGRIIPIRGN